MRSTDSRSCERDHPGIGVERIGFTLLEVLVALVVAALVLQSATEIVHGAIAHAAAMQGVVAAGEARRNSSRELRLLLDQVDDGATGGVLFSGTERSARFTTRCDVPQGWGERCGATITWEEDARRAPSSSREPRRQLALRVRTTTGRMLTIASDVRAGELRFLASTENGGEWIRTWRAGSTPPLALALLIERDTVIMRIGGRA